MPRTPHPGAMAALAPCYWGSVNQWECDENDHLNVRFFAHKIDQAVQILLSEVGGADPEEIGARIRCQHIRFLREARVVTPLRIDCGIVGRTDEVLDVVSLMHDNVSGTVLAGFVTRVATAGLTLDPLPPPIAGIPEPARPRGIDPGAVPEPPAGREAALEAGYRVVGRSLIGAEDCDTDGRLLPHAYVGRISDGMPNLWAFLDPEGDSSAREGAELGGAALEQRLEIVAPLQRGSVVTQLSGIRAIGNKTQQMAHVLYDETRDRVAATMEAVGVAMDLTTRRAVPISPERRKYLEKLLLMDP